MRVRVFLTFLGCRLNQSEIEGMARQLAVLGHEIVDSPADADLCIVNTCAVTAEAERKSRQLIRRLHRANPEAEIAVTGCYAHLAPAALAGLPGVVRVADNVEKASLVSAITGDEPPPEHAAWPGDWAPGEMGRTRAFVRVQTGCDNHCTFCVTRLARGRGVSRPLDEIISEVRGFVEAGYREVVLTGVNLGAYGRDLKIEHGLTDLVAEILVRTGVERLRLSSLEPWELDERFLGLWSDPRLCPHLHLPLQSGSASVLRRMARRTTPDEFRRIVEAARAVIPDLAVSTDVMVAFPGETEDEFAESLEFVESIGFSRIHVFRYSPRPGTAAARLPGRIPPDVAHERLERMLAVARESADRFRQRFIGRVMDVLWEKARPHESGRWEYHGLTGNYIRVRTVTSERITNSITPTLLLGLEGELMRGEVTVPEGDRREHTVKR